MLIHNEDPSRVAVVPVHRGASLPPGTLRAILRGARLTVEQLRELL